VAHHGNDNDVALLHLDYHPLNIMTDGTRVTGVLDWENAHAGDPRADLARTVSILLVDARGPHGPSDAERRMRLTLARGCLHGYAEVAGVPTAMAAFYAWAGEVMQRDLGPKREAIELARIRDWTDRRRRRAGLPDGW